MAPRANIRIDSPVTAGSGIVGPGWEFKPSIGVLVRDLEKFGHGIKSFREPLHKSVKTVLGPSFMENFYSQGRPDPWEPLSEATWKLRAELHGYTGGGILLRSGKLMKTMGQINIWTISQKSATIRDLPSSVWYGKLHQAGFSSTSGKMAARVAAHKATGMKTAQAMRFALEDNELDARSGIRPDVPVEIPQRIFAVIQDEDMDAIERVFAEWVEMRIARFYAGRP